MMSPTVTPEDVPFVEMGDPRYRFLFGKEVLMLTKGKPQPNKRFTDAVDWDLRCDGFNIGMLARGD